MFKKFKEIDGNEKFDLLLAESRHAWLIRKITPTLFVTISDEDDVLTSTKERNQRGETTSPWLENQLKKWKSQKLNQVCVADQEHPLKVLTGDINLILVIENKKYLLVHYRGIWPVGRQIPGGCPQNIEELFHPKETAEREVSEEVVIVDSEGNIYVLPFDKTTSIPLRENIKALNLAPKGIIPLKGRELSAKGGDAQALVIRHRNRRVAMNNVNATISSIVGALVTTIYWEIQIPVPLDKLRLYDGEKDSNGRMLKRNILLINAGNEVAADFSDGINMLTVGWHLRSDLERVRLPN